MKYMGLLNGMSLVLSIFLSLVLFSFFVSYSSLKRDFLRDGRQKADIRLAPHGRKLELFGRKHNTRPGWLTLGNQCTSISIVEVLEHGQGADK